jgi:hypothetical protein
MHVTEPLKVKAICDNTIWIRLKKILTITLALTPT